jgi:lysozyme
VVALVAIVGVIGILVLAMKGSMDATAATSDMVVPSPDGAMLDLGGTATGQDPALFDTTLSDQINAPSNSSGNTSYTLDDVLNRVIPILQQFEGFSAKAYPDPPSSGKYSIGYGHSIRKGDPYTSASVIGNGEATTLLRQDAVAAYTCVSQSVTAVVTLNQVAALTSFVYNEGCAAFKNSTMLKYINQGDFASAADQFPKWVIAGGQTNDSLVRRRQQEEELFVNA